jgi:hypothetical protein
MLHCFRKEPMFQMVIKALEVINGSVTIREKKRVQHRSSEYMIEEGKLWHIGGGTKAWAKARRECITQEEVIKMARKEHEQGGHWHWDGAKRNLCGSLHAMNHATACNYM